MNEDLAVPASLVVGRQDDYFLMFPFPLHLLWALLARSANRRTKRGEIYSVREMRPTAREFELMRSFGPAARLRSQNKFAATINYRPVRGAVFED